MELLCRYQQAPWWSLGIYTESILTTLIITRKFGRGYPIFDSSHQYGLTAWYRLLMYCIYNDSHWSLVTIFLGSGSWIVLRVDPSSPELDKDTRTILEHLKWTQTKGPNSRETSRGQEDILIDITVPAGRDTQTCGLRALQYHAIIGNAFAARPEILREGEVTMQTFVKEFILPQIQQVNAETTETYYNSMRLHLQQTEKTALLRTHLTWPDIQSLSRKRKSTRQTKTASNHNGEEQIYVVKSSDNCNYGNRGYTFWNRTTP